MASGFHQTQVDPEDIAKTVFSTEQGHFQFLRMPYGLKNNSSTFQRMMDNDSYCEIANCFVYLDDIIIHSTSLQEYAERLKQVFERLRKSNLKVQLDKTELLLRSRYNI